MIDPRHPDYHNTPASEQRPRYHYVAAEAREPLVSIITPYFNAGPVFWETFRAVQRLSLPYWEWLIVDDGSESGASLEQLREAVECELRIRVLRQPNGGPAVARNHAARVAHGRYLLLLDSDDMVEPTFVEKAVWFLETQAATFAAVSAHNVTFGAKNFLWPYGFERGVENLRENFVTSQAVVRRDAYLAVGGFDERVSYEHADWDFWLSLAEAGLWGQTLPEYLTWYRTAERSLMVEIESDRERAQRFRRWLGEKHLGLERRFPRPKLLPAGTIPAPERHASISVTNPLAKPEGVRRVLLIAPWLQMGGADRFNLDLIEQLTGNGYEFSVVTTLRDEHPWLSAFTRITPDVFCLHNFLNLADYPRFISYLIESRQIDAALVSNSEFGYALLPYLRARHPEVALLDYTHMEEPDAPLGGYPGLSLQAGDLLDLRVTNTEHLKEWMTTRGAPSDTVEVRRCAIDLSVWKPDADARRRARMELQAPEHIPLVVFMGRMVAQKRPRLFAETLAQVARRGVDFSAVAVGDGEGLRDLRRVIKRYGLTERVKTLGAAPPEVARQILQAADIVLLPSAMEGLSFVLIEAMAVGAVPVAARVGGQSELVTPESGYLIERGEGEALLYAAAVERLAKDAALREAMACEARRRVERDFGMELFAEGMRQGIDRAISLACAHTAQSDAHVGELACAAVMRVARQDAQRARWLAGNGHPIRHRIRWARQAMLPMGTSRYDVYKRFRERLRGDPVS